MRRLLSLVLALALLLGCAAAEAAEPRNEDAQQVLAELRKISATLPGTMQPARIELRDQPFEKSPSMKIIRKK